jgi:8-oxo-dGTP diphosphatase
MKLYLIRHAHAGSRMTFDGPDDDRPLSRRGHKQATAIAENLAEVGIGRLVSSPTTRCVQTLEPLADRLCLTVDGDLRLIEGADPQDALDLAGELRDGAAAAVMCSHGDVIPDMLRLLRAGTTRFKDPFVWPKASTWVLTWDGDRWAKARYIAPPNVP